MAIDDCRPVPGPLPVPGYMLANVARLHVGGIGGGVVENSRLPAGALAIAGAGLYKQVVPAGAGCNPRGGPVAGQGLGYVLANVVGSILAVVD